MSYYDPPEYVDRCESPCIDERPVILWSGEERPTVWARCEYLRSGEIEIYGKRCPVHYCTETGEFMNDREAHE